MRDKTKNSSLLQTVIITFGGIFLVIGLVMGFLQLNRYKQFKEDYEHNQEVIDELTEKTDTVEAKAKLEEIEKSKESMADTVLKATEAGNEVEKLQTEFHRLFGEENSEKRAANVSEIDNYFDEDSRNCRVEWYPYYPNTKSYTWTFHNIYNYTEDSILVIWTCRGDENDELLAYTIGKYDADTELFYDTEHYRTLVGCSYATAD